MKKAEYYFNEKDGTVLCELCPHKCHIAAGSKGLCNSRVNRDGVLYTENYGETVTINPYDPVEKKPLFHFLPGSRVLSIGANLCNLNCNYCQNYSISQEICQTQSITPEYLEQLMLNHGLKSIAYTYTEPVIWYEFVKDSAAYLKNKGFHTIFVSNGFINQEPLLALLPHIDAFNIDLKSIRDDFYQRNCGGRVEPVKDAIRTISGNSHIEVTNLLITDENDSDDDIIGLIDFIASVDVRLPLHFSRYYPCYKLNKPATNIDRLNFAYKEAKKKLKHVYLGNIAFDNELICEKCGTIIAHRDYDHSSKIKDGKCPNCDAEIYGIWQD